MKSSLAFVALILSYFSVVVSPYVFSSYTDSSYVEGRHYLTLVNAPTIQPQIMLFHSPFCGPCATVHEPLMQIAEKHNSEVREIIVGAGPIGRDVQEAFIVAKEQGEEKAFIQELIHRIHFQRNQTPQFREDLMSVLDVCGVSLNKFERRCQSIDQQVEDFNSLVRSYRINATPTIVINGNKQIVLHRLKSFEELDALISELLKS